MTSTRPSDRLDHPETMTRDLYRAAFAGSPDVADRRHSPGTSRSLARIGATTAAGLALAVGSWLVAAPFLLGYARPEGVDGYGNSIATGAAIALVALFGLSRPRPSPASYGLSAGLGGWLLLAQHVLGYADSAPRAALNEGTCGVIVVLLGMAGLGMTVAGGRPRRVGGAP